MRFYLLQKTGEPVQLSEESRRRKKSNAGCVVQLTRIKYYCIYIRRYLEHEEIYAHGSGSGRAAVVMSIKLESDQRLQSDLVDNVLAHRLPTRQIIIVLNV